MHAKQTSCMVTVFYFGLSLVATTFTQNMVMLLVKNCSFIIRSIIMLPFLKKEVKFALYNTLKAAKTDCTD